MFDMAKSYRWLESSITTTADALDAAFHATASGSSEFGMPQKKCMALVKILYNCAISSKAYFSTVCLSSNHIWLIVTLEFDDTSQNHVSSIQLSWYQSFALCLHKICVAHYFMCKLPMQTTTGNLVVFTQIKHF